MEKFRVVNQSDGEKQLLFNSEYPKECCDFAITHNIRRVSVFDRVYADHNLDPLLPLKDFLEGLILKEDVDFSQLGQFANLRVLGALDNKKNILDLECFPKLETLACSVTPRLRGLESHSSLKSLTISYYNPKEGDLSVLPTPKSLESLFIIKTTIRSLNGIERFKTLQKFRLYSASKIVAIAALRGLAETLQELIIESCKKIEDFEILVYLTRLEKLILAESGHVENLSFLKCLPHLKHFSFVGTKVIDGNLKWCEGIRFVGFDDKRHYSHKMKHFKP